MTGEKKEEEEGRGSAHWLLLLLTWHSKCIIAGEKQQSTTRPVVETRITFHR